MSTRNIINSKFYEVAQGDINGNITGLITANLTANANVSLGNISNVHITGGTSGQFIQTDGNGNLTFANVVVSPGGANTQVQFNKNGSFGGDANFTYDTATDQLTAPVIEAQEFSGIVATFSNLEIDTLANLGNVANVRIYGGTSGQYLQTNGNGGVTWANASGGGGVTQPYVLFTANAAGNNQTFTSDSLNTFPSGQYCIIFKNGVSLDPSEYTVLGNILTINNYLRVGDSISVAPTGGGGGGGGALNLQQVLFYGNTANIGLTLTGSATYTGNGSGLTSIPGANVTGTVALANVSNSANIANSARNANLAALANVAIDASFASIANRANRVDLANVVGIGNIANINLNGNSLQFLAGNGSWARPAPNLQEVTSYGSSSNANIALSGANISLGSISNVHISGGSNNQFLQTDGNGNLSFTAALTQIPNLQAVLTQGNTANIDIQLTSNITANTINLTTLQANLANLVIQGKARTSSTDPQGNIQIVGGVSNYSGQAGSVLITGGTGGAGSSGGNVILSGGANGSGTTTPGSVQIQGKINLGNISNINITGGSTGELLTTDGNGNLSFAPYSFKWNAYASNMQVGAVFVGFPGDGNARIPPGFDYTCNGATSANILAWHPVKVTNSAIHSIAYNQSSNTLLCVGNLYTSTSDTNSNQYMYVNTGISTGSLTTRPVYTSPNIPLQGTQMRTIVSTTLNVLMVGTDEGILIGSGNSNVWTPPIGGDRIGAINSIALESALGINCVAVGEPSRFSTNNGQTFQTLNTGVTETLNGVAHLSSGNSLFFAVGSNGSFSYGNTSSSNWTGGHLTGDKANLSLNSIAFGNGASGSTTTAVIVADNGRIFTSSNVVNTAGWVEAFSGTNNALRDVIYTGNVWIAVGDRGTILTSTAGRVWQPSYSGTTEDLLSVNLVTSNTDPKGNRIYVTGSGGTILSARYNYLIYLNPYYDVTFGGNIDYSAAPPGTYKSLGMIDPSVPSYLFLKTV